MHRRSKTAAWTQHSDRGFSASGRRPQISRWLHEETRETRNAMRSGPRSPAENFHRRARDVAAGRASGPAESNGFPVSVSKTALMPHMSGPSHQPLARAVNAAGRVFLKYAS